MSKIDNVKNVKNVSINLTPGVLLIFFILLVVKLTNPASMAWFWVFLPLWFWPAFILGCVVFMLALTGIIFLVAYTVDCWNNWRASVARKARAKKY